MQLHASNNGWNDTPLWWLKLRGAGGSSRVAPFDFSSSLSGTGTSQESSLVTAYVAMMGPLSSLNRTHPLWWATDVASRNRVNAATITEADNWIVAHAVVYFAKKNQLELLFEKNAPVILAQATQILAHSEGVAVCSASFKKSQKFSRRLRQIATLSKEALRSARWIFKAKRRYGRPGRSLSSVYLIRSFTYQTAFKDDQTYRDPFFGPLAQHLEQRGKEVVTIIQGFSDRLECYANIPPSLRHKLIPSEVFLSVLTPFVELARIVFYAAFKPLRSPQFLSMDQTQLPDASANLTGINWAPLAQAALEEAIWTIQLPQSMMEENGRQIAQHFDIEAFVTTCEANPWELMLIRGLRQKSGFPILGYQHSVVPPAALGMFTSREEQAFRPAPDKILTTGSATASILRRYGKGNIGRVEPACALRYEYLFNIKSRNARRSPCQRILVALEGLIEAADMVAYLLREAPEAPDITFLVRCHPVLPLQEFLSHLEYRGPLPNNIQVSKQESVLEDLRDCDAVLYWSTTVALEAVLYGLPLLHFKKEGLFDYDPLSEMSSFKVLASTNRPLNGAISTIDKWSDEHYVREREKAQNYIQQYFHPVSEDAISRFLPGAAPPSSCIIKPFE